MGDIDFDGKDVIVVVDQVQVHWLARQFGPELRDAQIHPISLQAHGAALRLGIGRTTPAFSDSDFRVCDQDARTEIFRLARDWLQELGLNFLVADIDVAQLDATCQFLLFLNCVYVQRAALTMLHSVCDQCRINIVASVDPLPLDFYFDSDVSCAVLRHVLDAHGREPRLLRMEKRGEYLFRRRRPFVLSEADGMSDELPPIAKPGSRRCSRYRVGIVPATIANAEGYLDALRQLDCEIHSFASAWSPYSEQSCTEARHLITAADGPWSERIRAELRKLKEEIPRRIGRSSLPGCIAANRHLQFQWNYIFEQRWLAYANMIMRARAFSESHPLDLLIHCDHFTAEAAILSKLYRRKKTRVLVAPHSGWPVDAEWTLGCPGKYGMVASRSAAGRLAAVSGMSKILVAGGELVRPYERLCRTAQTEANASRVSDVVSGRKLVVVMTNALELNGVPFTALASHVHTLSKLALPPDRLRSRVFVAVRRKPGIFGDSGEMLERLCGFSSEAVSLTDSLSIAEAVRLADCVVGVNVGTSGYFDILEESCPLIHVQTAEVSTLHPDLPVSALPRVTKDEDIWPRIESLLFDSALRDEVSRNQAAFISQDRRPQFDGDPLESAIRRIRGRDLGWLVHSCLEKLRSPSTTPASPANVTAHKTPSATAEQHYAGWLDDVLSASNSKYVLLGWAADLRAALPARRVHAFLNGTHLASCCPSIARPDVAAACANSNLAYTGFRLPVRIRCRKELQSLAVYAETQDSCLVRLAVNPLLSPLLR